MSAENVVSHVPLCDSVNLDRFKKHFGSLDFENMTGSMIEHMIDEQLAEIHQEEMMSTPSVEHNEPLCDSVNMDLLKKHFGSLGFEGKPRLDRKDILILIMELANFIKIDGWRSENSNLYIFRTMQNIFTLHQLLKLLQ